MQKEFTHRTTINGNAVTLTTTLTISEEEIQQIFQRKQAEFIQSLGSNSNSTEPCSTEQPTTSFSYESYEDDSQQEQNYVPYSSVAAESTQTQIPDAYTPYASTSQMPKSYHPELQNGYAPYNTWRVNVPSDKKITIE